MQTTCSSSPPCRVFVVTGIADLPPGGDRAPVWGVSSGPVIWLRGRFSTSGGRPASAPAPSHGAGRGLGCARGLRGPDRVAGTAAGGRAGGAAAHNDRLRSVLWEAMLRFSYPGAPVDVFEGVIVGNHRIALWFRDSIFKCNQCSIPIFLRVC